MSVAKKSINFEDDPGHSGKFCARIPFSDVEQGAYYLYAYIQDKEGNGTATVIASDNCDKNGALRGIHFYLRNKTPVVQKVADKNLKVMFPEGESGRMNRFRLEQEDNKWVWKEFDGIY